MNLNNENKKKQIREYYAKRAVAVVMATAISVGTQTEFAQAFIDALEQPQNSETSDVQDEVAEVEDIQNIDTTSSQAITINKPNTLPQGIVPTALSGDFYGVFTDEIAGQKLDEWKDIDYSNKTLSRFLAVNYSTGATKADKHISLTIPAGLQVTSQPAIGTGVGQVKSITSIANADGSDTYTYNIGSGAGTQTAFNVALGIDYSEFNDGMPVNISGILSFGADDLLDGYTNKTFSVTGNFKDIYSISYEPMVSTIRSEGTELDKPIKATVSLSSKGDGLLQALQGNGTKLTLHDYKTTLDLSKIKVKKAGGSLRYITADELAAIQVTDVVDGKDGYATNYTYNAIYDNTTHIVTITAPKCVYSSKYAVPITFPSTVFSYGDTISFIDCLGEGTSYGNAEKWGGRVGGTVGSINATSNGNNLLEHASGGSGEFVFAIPESRNTITLSGATSSRRINKTKDVIKYHRDASGKQDLFKLFYANDTEFDLTDVTLTVEVPEGVTVTDIFLPNVNLGTPLTVTMSDGQILTGGRYHTLNTPLTGSFDIKLNTLPSKSNIGSSGYYVTYGIKFGGIIPTSAVANDQFKFSVVSKSATYTDSDSILHENSDYVAGGKKDIILTVDDYYNTVVKSEGLRYLDSTGAISSVTYDKTELYQDITIQIMNSYLYKDNMQYLNDIVTFVSIPDGIKFDGKSSSVYIDGVNSVCEVSLVNDSFTAEGRKGQLYKIVLPAEAYLSGKYSNCTFILDNKTINMKLKVAPDATIIESKGIKILPTDVLITTSNSDFNRITGFVSTKLNELDLTAMAGFADYDLSGLTKMAGAVALELGLESLFNVEVPPSVVMTNSTSIDGEIYSTWNPSDTEYKTISSLYIGANASFKTQYTNGTTTEAKNALAYFVIPKTEQYDIVIDSDTLQQSFANQKTSTYPKVYYTSTKIEDNSKWLSDGDTTNGSGSSVVWTEVTGALPNDVTAIKYHFDTIGIGSSYTNIIPFNIVLKEGGDDIYGNTVGASMYQYTDSTDQTHAVSVTGTAGFKIMKSDKPTITVSGMKSDELDLNSDASAMNNSEPWKIYEISDDYSAVTLDEVNSKVIYTPNGGSATEVSIAGFTGIDTSTEGVYEFVYVTTSDDDLQVSTVKRYIIEVKKLFTTKPVISVSNEVDEIDVNFNKGSITKAELEALFAPTAVDCYGKVLTVVTDFRNITFTSTMPYTFTLTATDENGGKTTRTVTLNVIDDSKPVINVPKLTPDGGVYSITMAQTTEDTVFTTSEFLANTLGAYVSDNLDANLAITVKDLDKVKTTVIGEYSVVLSTEDRSGNKADDVTIIIKVISGLTVNNPVIKVPVINKVTTDGYTSNREPSTAEILTLADVVAKGSVTFLTPLSGFDFTTTNSTEQTITISTTIGGSTSTATINFTVVDELAPVIKTTDNKTSFVLPVDQTITDEFLKTLMGLTVIDNYDEANDITVAITNDINKEVPGTYNAEVTATDKSGNETKKIYSMVVGVAPTINNANTEVTVDISKVSLSKEDFLKAVGGTAISSDGKALTIQSDFTDLTFADLGTESSSVYAVDAQGSRTELPITINIVDGVAPVVDVANSSFEVAIGSTITKEVVLSKAGATVSDYYDILFKGGSIDIAVTDLDKVNTSKLGLYTVKLTATDSSGNTSATINVVIGVVNGSTINVVKDTITVNYDSPTLTTAEFLAQVGATASDFEGTPLIIETDFTDTTYSDLGSKTYKVYATDSFNTTVERTITVNVVDITKPTISIDKNIVAVAVGSELTVEGILKAVNAKATDNYDTNVTITIIDLNTFDTSKEYSDIVTIRVTDSSGNYVDKPIIVTTKTGFAVGEKVIKVPVINKNTTDFDKNQTPTLADILVLAKATAVNNDYSLADIKTDDDLSSFDFVTVSNVPQYIKIYTELEAGTRTEETIEFTVVDTVSPIIKVDANKMTFGLVCENDTVVTDELLKTVIPYKVLDNYDLESNLVISLEHNIDVTTSGTYPVTITAKDSSGNVAQKVVVDVVVAISPSPVVNRTFVGDTTIRGTGGVAGAKITIEFKDGTTVSTVATGDVWSVDISKYKDKLVEGDKFCVTQTLPLEYARVSEKVENTIYKNTDTGNGGGGNGGGSSGGGGGHKPNKDKPTVEPEKPEKPEEAEILIDPYISGYTDGTVRPNGNITRAEVAQVIYNIYGDNKAVNKSILNNYSDINTNAWYSDAIAYATQTGVFEGYNDGTFKPNNPISREEVSAIIDRLYFDEMISYGKLDIKLLDIQNSWAKEDIEQLVSKGIITGYPDGTFRPKQPIERDEFVAMMNKSTNRPNEYKVKTTFSDLSAGEWNYEGMMNASNYAIQKNVE